MSLKYFLSGFIVKLVTGIDDSLIHIPIIVNTTKTKIGKIAFVTGVLLAIALAILFSIIFSSTIKQIPYHRYIAATLVFFLAFMIYFDILVRKPQQKFETKIKPQIKPITTISKKRFMKLLTLGFLASFVTVIDDTIAYSALFLTSSSIIPYAAAGIFLASLVELTIIVYFSKKLNKLPYKKEISILGLITLGTLILLKII
jgi:hypothetical protein